MPENTNAVRDSDRNYGHKTSPKNVLVLPPYSEFKLHPVHGAVLQENKREPVWPQDCPRIFFGTGAAMWMNESRTKKGGGFTESAKQWQLWLLVAFGRIPLDGIEFRKNEEMKS